MLIAQLDLIKIGKSDIDGKLIETVDARGLHEFLEVGKDFSTWMKDRIEKYEFQENIDFTTFPKNGEPVDKGFATKIEYHLTVDMAKEVAMVERNEKGRQARQWFIKREKKLQGIEHKNVPVKQFKLPQTMLEALQELVKALKVNKQLENQLQEAQPKIEFYEQVGDTKGVYTVGTTAKILGFGRNIFFKILRRDSIFFKYEPYQRYIDCGYFVVKTVVVNEYIQDQTFVTSKGFMWLQKKYKTHINKDTNNVFQIR